VTNLPRVTAAGVNLLALFADHTLHVFRDAGRTGHGISRASFERLRRDGLISLGDYRPLYGRPVALTELGREVLAARSTTAQEG
jgi:hypothetical protein